MRKTLCKGFALLFILICCISPIYAQDSSKTTSTNVASKPTTKPLAKTQAVQSPQVTQPSSSLNTTQPAQLPPDASLEEQYQFFLKKSWPTKTGWRVINPNSLTTLWKSVNDSLSTYKRLLADEKSKSEKQAALLAESKTGSQSSEQLKSKPSAVSVSEVNLLGMPISLDTYNIIVWGLILVLGIGLAVVIFTTSKNSNDAKHHRQLYDELSSEYNTFKSKAKDKELKLARELQTERNTIEDLLAKRAEEAERRGRKD